MGGDYIKQFGGWRRDHLVHRPFDRPVIGWVPSDFYPSVIWGLFMFMDNSTIIDLHHYLQTPNSYKLSCKANDVNSSMPYFQISPYLMKKAPLGGGAFSFI